MKTKLFFIFILLLPFSVSAQKATIGPAFSFLLSNNSQFDFSSFDNKRASISYGINYSKQISTKFFLETGFQYLAQGAQYKSCLAFPEGEEHNIVIKRDYLIIPLNLMYGIGSTNNWKLSLGLYGAYNVKAIQDYPEPIGGCNRGYPRDITGNTERFYLGFSTGIYYIVFSNELFEINLGVDYFKNLTQINAFVNNNSFGLDAKFNLKL